MQGLVGDGRSETMRGFHRKQRTQRRARPWLSALALASVSTIITSPQAYAQQNSSSSSSSSSSLCGSDDTIQVGDATGLASLQAAVNCSGGGEVVAVWSSDVTLDSPVLVGSGTFLSILGQDGGDAVARGDYETRLFEVSEGAELTLSKLEVTQGSAGSGGAIRSLGTLVLESCSIDENVATTGNGGAIWASGGSLTISGTEFNGNSAVKHGGAVYTLDTKVVIQDSSRFESNQAVEAGAVYCGTANCTFSDSFFLNNNASSETQVDYDDIVDFDETPEDENPWAFLYGGGAATFENAEVDITNCVFTNNSAQVAGGALYGGFVTDLNISGCTFEGNIALGYGAAIASSSATFGGGTVLRGNYANKNGGGFFLWDDANCTLNDVTCVDNEAGANGGCLYGVGTVVISDEAVMQGNEAEYGGCIYAYGNIQVPGGTFTGCEASENGGFMFSSDGSVVTVTGGNIVSNTAKRGAAIYSSGPSRDLGGGAVTVFGGNITDNVALELGGAFAAWGEPTLITVKGGTFRNNSGQFYGGFVFLEEGASVSCEGATIIENVAGDQGGGIYARDATWVNSSCDLISNEAPQGAAAYLTHVEHPARFDNFSITDNVASGGSVFYVAESSVILTEVTFESSIALQEDSSNRAVQLDDGSTLFGDGCVFTGWLGDTVVRSANADSGSLVLNSCDFRGNSATMMVVSPHSDAEIRNALVDEITLANAVVENGSAVLVDRALNCSGAGACGDGGECVDSVLGVLCVCIDDDTPCLTDGGTLTLEVTTSPENVTYNPDLVQFELTASAAEGDTTSAIWALTYEADEMELEVVPESGVLLPGTNITITVSGTPVGNDVGGSLASNFSLISVGNASVLAQTVEVQSTYYLCQAFQYAVPADGDDSAESVECEQCAVIDDADGVDCDDPGATLASLPIRSGYWRPSNASLEVQACLHSKACEGATVATSSDDYCSTGYQGPLCAVCKKGYGRGSGYACHSCEGTMTVGLITVGSLFIVLIVILLVLTVVFLVGGLDAVGNMGRTLSSNFSISRPMAPAVRPTLTGSEDGVFHSGLKRAWTAPTPDASSEPTRGLRRSHAMTGIGSDVPVGSSRASPVSAVSSVTSAIGMRDGLLKIERSDKASKVWTEESRSGRASPDLEHKPDSSATAAAPSAAVIGAEGDGSRPGCCGFGDRIKRLWSRVPLDKLKILVVVWQILTVFPSIAAVDFPPVYSRFLSWIDVVNLDLANVFSASCIFPGLNFYQRLLAITLAPIALCGVLVVTYQLAARRAEIGSAGIIAKRAAWSRHMATGLLLTFLVFTSASTVVFKTFGCDPNAVEGKSYLRADYSLSCETPTHTYYKIYAGFMLLVYPIGIPLLYAFILWKNRYLLNPTLAAAARAEQEQKAAEGDQETGSVDQSNADAQRKKYLSPQEEEELERMVKLRKTNPDLVPSMFLWKDFGPNLYYYEVIECGRRILLTGVLIFIDPYSPAQAAAACIFAFGSLLGFELLRPHLDPADAWLYRLGCVVIFLSNFLALLIKVDAAGEGNGEALGTLLVIVNVFLVIAVIFTSWFSTQQQVDDAKDDENTYTMAMDMVNVENLARQATSDPSLNSTSLYPRIARTSAASVGPGASSRRVPVGRPRSGEEKSDIDISATDIEELWQRDKSRQHSLR